jgi:hypothetical protein
VFIAHEREVVARGMEARARDIGFKLFRIFL